MRVVQGLLLLTALLGVSLARAEPDPPASSTPVCKDPAAALGVARIIEVDASAGPIFGSTTKRTREPTFLEPKEVVLTFDDGPVPRSTLPILDTLDAFCTKATFFAVGEMAIEYPQAMREVALRGHTIGTHTWTHPLNLRSIGADKAKEQIERGIAAVALAAGEPIAPFFRFPGLSDSDELLAYLQTRSIASFTVDVISNDSFIASSAHIAERTLKEIEAKGGGIVLFHDLKTPTAKAVPKILAELKARGYRIVHLVAKQPAVPLETYEAEMKQVLAARHKAAAAETVAEARAARPLPKSLAGEELPVSYLAPAPVDRLAPVAPSTEQADVEGPIHKAQRRARKSGKHKHEAASAD